MLDVHVNIIICIPKSNFDDEINMNVESLYLNEKIK